MEHSQQQSGDLRVKRAGGLATVACIALAVTGCDVYGPPQELLHAHDAGGGGDDDHEGIELAGSCTGDLPVVESSPEHREATTEGLESHLSTLAGCGERGLRGGDGFFAIDAAAGDRWHVAIEPEKENHDVVAYRMPLCDGATCDLFVDRCGAGVEEDFTFPVGLAGRYIIGVGSHSDSGPVSITAVKLQCGDGNRTHGEPCDDGNLMDGDGCSAECRVELEAPVAREVEPNNWHPEANVLRIGPGRGGATAITIAGSLGGPCDQDHYVLALPDDWDIRMTMLDGAGEPCTGDRSGVKMMLMDVVTTQALASGQGTKPADAAGAGGTCPSIAAGSDGATDLDAGDYHIMLVGPRESEQFDYRLEVEIGETLEPPDGL